MKKTKNENNILENLNKQFDVYEMLRIERTRIEEQYKLKTNFINMILILSSISIVCLTIIEVFKIIHLGG